MAQIPGVGSDRIRTLSQWEGTRNALGPDVWKRCRNKSCRIQPALWSSEAVMIHSSQSVYICAVSVFIKFTPIRVNLTLSVLNAGPEPHQSWEPTNKQSNQHLTAANTRRSPAQQITSHRVYLSPQSSGFGSSYELWLGGAGSEEAEHRQQRCNERSLDGRVFSLHRELSRADA